MYIFVLPVEAVPGMAQDGSVEHTNGGHCHQYGDDRRQRRSHTIRKRLQKQTLTHGSQSRLPARFRKPHWVNSPE